VVNTYKANEEPREEQISSTLGLRKKNTEASFYNMSLPLGMNLAPGGEL
jgi:hypothetical protein